MLASFHLNVPPTLGTVCLFGTADKLVSVGMLRLTDEITQAVRPAGKMMMGKGCRGINPAYDAGASLPLS
jgi:hypothetical protein